MQNRTEFERLAKAVDQGILDENGKNKLRTNQIDVNGITDRRGRTLLHRSIDNNQDTITEFLINLPTINIQAADNEGKTPLHYAAEKGNQRIFDMLSEKLK